MDDKEKEKLFKEFLEVSEVMVIDKSSASRRRLVKTLIDMGANRTKVHSVGHFAEGIEIINDKKPQLILSDYELRGGSGFDLFKEYRLKHPDEKKTSLILVTSNISQSAVARAGEEDVDCFIIKPYTVKSLEQNLVGTILGKLFPTKYMQTIEEGKNALHSQNFDDALALFEKAKEMDEKPSLALFYHGQVKYMIEAIMEAEGDYKKGLEINNIHFKCQVGLYELFMKDKKFDEAYSVVRNIAKYFPANPDRLKEVIHLAILTKNYADMEILYDIFIQLDERPTDVINYICSGLYVSGKFHFLEGDTSKGREIFEKVGVSCSGTVKFLSAMIKLLVKFDIYDDAQKLVARYSASPEDKGNYMIGNYIAYSNSAQNTEKISRGLELWNGGFKDPDAMGILIEALQVDGSTKKAELYLEEAINLWPDFSRPSQGAAS